MSPCTNEISAFMTRSVSFRNIMKSLKTLSKSKSGQLSGGFSTIFIKKNVLMLLGLLKQTVASSELFFCLTAGF